MSPARIPSSYWKIGLAAMRGLSCGCSVSSNVAEGSMRRAIPRTFSLCWRIISSRRRTRESSLTSAPSRRAAPRAGARRARRSIAREAGLALLEESRCAFLLVARLEQDRLDERLDLEPRAERHLGGEVHRLLGEADREGPALEDAARDGERARDELRRRNHGGDEADPLRLLRVDHVAREDDVARAAPSDRTRQALRTAGGRD